MKLKEEDIPDYDNIYVGIKSFVIEYLFMIPCMMIVDEKIYMFIW